MNYKQNYYRLIEYRKQNPPKENFEIHHIIPKSLGGTDEEMNLIKLKYREHFLAHYLLWKFSTGKEHLKMAMAFKLMSKNFKLTSRVYKRLKEELSKKVICLQTLQVFDSVNDTVLWLSASLNKPSVVIKRNLNLVLRKKRKSIFGYYFEFFENNKQYKKIEIIKNKQFKNNAKKVICLQTLEVFDSAREAEKRTNISFKNISNSCRLNSSTKGYDFRFFDENEIYKKEPIKKIHKQNNYKIKCVETGEVFASLNKLSKSIDISRSNITKCIKLNKSYNGLHYIFEES